MTKFTGFESEAITTGLKLFKDAVKQEISEGIAAGKRPIMTPEFIDIQIEEVIKKVISMTKKQRV